MTPFDPLFRNPHMQTIAGHYWPRPEAPVTLKSRLVQTEPGVQVLVQSQQPGTPAKGHLVMVHGMESSGAAGYIRSLAALACAHGYAAHRFHMRTCGGTERLCPTLYHAGLTGDLLAVLRQFPGPAFLAGFSLGGNLVLKLAGELASAAPELIRGTCAVSTPLDLAATALAGTTGVVSVAAWARPCLKGTVEAEVQGHGTKHGLSAVWRAEEEDRMVSRSGHHQGPLGHLIAAD